MDYNRLKKLFDEKISNKQEFFSSIGMSSSGFYAMLSNESLKVKILEAISDVMSVSPSYWWQDEDEKLKLEIEPGNPCGSYIPRSVYNDLVKKWNEDRESKKKLEDQLTTLLGLLNAEKNKKAC